MPRFSLMLDEMQSYHVTDYVFAAITHQVKVRDSMCIRSHYSLIIAEALSGERQQERAGFGVTQAPATVQDALLSCFCQQQ